jgi:hypothetical protein
LDIFVFLENDELRTFSSLTAVAAFSFDVALQPASAEDDLGSWQLTDCVPVKTEDLSQIESDLNRIAGDPSLSVTRLSQDANSLFKVRDDDSFQDVIPVVTDDDRGAATVDRFGVSVDQRGLVLNRLNGGDEDGTTDGSDISDVGHNANAKASIKDQTALLRQPRTARIGKAASLAVLMASHLDSAKCDSM